MTRSPPARQPRIFVTRHLPGVEPTMRERYDAVLNSDDHTLTRDELIAGMRDCDVLIPCVTDRVDAAAIADAGSRLGLIANFGAGVEHLDLVACARAGIKVSNTPHTFTDDTADITMALILGAARRLGEGTRLITEQRWTGWTPSHMLGTALSGKRLAIVGMGAIGQALARRARAFGMEIAYHNRRPLDPALAEGARFCADLDTMIAGADFLSLNCPATPETKGLLDARRLGLMKRGSFVINSGRGDLIDEDALVAALDSGHLAGAGLDVFRGEPAVDPRLATMPQVFGLPHLGSATVEGRTAAGEKIIANIEAWLAGEPLPDGVPTA
ncbi:MAG TPA: D-glycerate dehydrogenase [Croceibacterium sp.]|nr:D-glycerate dehydrogenase [Croceibacterium sp.]